VPYGVYAAGLAVLAGAGAARRRPRDDGLAAPSAWTNARTGGTVNADPGLAGTGGGSDRQAKMAAPAKGIEE
jgi:hypothetical protein